MFFSLPTFTDKPPLIQLFLTHRAKFVPSIFARVARVGKRTEDSTEAQSESGKFAEDFNLGEENQLKMRDRETSFRSCTTLTPFSGGDESCQQSQFQSHLI